MKWWGWGDPDHEAKLPEAALAALRSELGAPDRQVAVPALDDLVLPDPTLKKKARARQVDAVGDAWVKDDRPTRPERAIPTWSAGAPGRSSSHPTPSCIRQTPGRCA